MRKLYMELIRMRFLTMLAYRVNYYSGIIIYAINIGAYYFLWGAIAVFDCLNRSLRKLGQSFRITIVNGKVRG